MQLSSNRGHNASNGKKDVIIIYLASGSDPFGKDSISNWENKFFTHFEAGVKNRGLRSEVYLINSQNEILIDGNTGRFSEYEEPEKMPKNYTEVSEGHTVIKNGDPNLIKFFGHFEKFKEKRVGCYYNGNATNYNPDDSMQIKAKNPSYNYNLLNRQSADFYSKWIDNIIQENPTSKIVIIEGFGGDMKNIPNLSIKKAKSLEQNENIHFVASCSCCVTGIIGERFLSQFTGQNRLESLPVDGFTRCNYNLLEAKSETLKELDAFTDLMLSKVDQKKSIDLGGMLPFTSAQNTSYNTSFDLPSIQQRQNKSLAFERADNEARR